MRILVTGITGQIGSAIAARLAEFATVIPAGRDLLDLAEPQRLAAQLDAISPDLVVNPAAYTSVEQAEYERELAFLVNGTSPGLLAQWAANHRVPFVHFSTDYVFDGSGERPWREDDRVGPLNAYGASKLAGEHAVQSAGGAYLIVRTSWVYGARGVNFLSTMTRLMQGCEELRIVADQFGAPTPANCVVNALVDIVKRNPTTLSAVFGAANGKLHIAASGATTWHGFAEAILEGLKTRSMDLAARKVVPIASDEYPTRARRPRNSRLDISRLAETFRIRTKPWDVLLEAELDMLVARLKTSGPLSPTPRSDAAF